MLLKLILLHIFLTTFSLVSFAHELEIKYTANAGVKISSGKQTVLIDTLFGPHGFFNSLDEEAFSALIMQGADVVLSTHAHSDHFGAKRTSQFLRKNLKSNFIGTPEMLPPLDEDIDSAQLASASLNQFQSQGFDFKLLK
jgi:hypothetical protein